MLPRPLLSILAILLLLSAALSAAEVEVFTLTDGRTLTGTYDEDQGTLTLSGKMVAVLNIRLDQIVTREPAGTAAKSTSTPTSTTTPATGGGGDATEPIPFTLSNDADPKVLEPLVAPGVPWADGDRVLFIGDLLEQEGQPELARRIHELLATRLTDKRIEVFALQNRGITLERWATVGKAEIERHPPKLVVIMAGVGEVMAVLPEPQPVVRGAPPSPPPTLSLVSADAFRSHLLVLTTAAKEAGAAVVVVTPGIVGDKPFGGMGSDMLDSYAIAARGVATDAEAVLCDLRGLLIGVLNERNPKATRELGVLSRTFGQLKPEAMDLCAGLVAESIAKAVPRIPWTVALPGAAGSGSVTVTVATPRLAADQVALFVTTDGSEPTSASPAYTAPITVKETSLVRVLAQAKADDARRFAKAWYVVPVRPAAGKPPAETLPGLWVDHFPSSTWGEGMPSVEGVEPDWSTWWYNAEAAVIDHLPKDSRPASVSCLRYTGYVVAPVDGIYRFDLAASGEARLFIGGCEVVAVAATGQPADRQGGAELTAGFHACAVFHRPGAGERTLAIRIAEPGQRLRPLPDLVLQRDAVRPVGAAAVIEPIPDGVDPEALWTARLAGGIFSGTTKVELTIVGMPADRTAAFYTTDGKEPTRDSDRYGKPFTISSTTQVRMLVTSLNNPSTQTVAAWYMKGKEHAADPAPSESLPGLWMEHVPLQRWNNPISSIDRKRADFVSWWPSAELESFSVVPVHRWPNDLFGLRFSGWFYAPVDGSYVFSINSDDAARITLGTVAVLRNDDLHPDRLQREAVTLTRGFHKLELPYGQGPGIITLDVSCGLSGQRLQPLPDVLLRRSPKPPSSDGISYDSPEDEEPTLP